MRLARQVARLGEKMVSQRGLLGKYEGNRSLGRPRRRWEHHNKDLSEVRCEGVGWIHVTQDMDKWRAVVLSVMNFRFHKI